MKPGEQIGDYIIVDKVGEGGMSVVYLAERRRERTQVVVKQLREHLAFDEQLVDRFVQGAQIMQQLRHPHLARVLDYIEHDGKFFMVEEYLSGGSLADLLAKGQPFSQEEALRWCRDALHAVNYAHQNGIVHRDLKPGNLMLNEKREVKVTDFGIAKVFGGPRLTKTGGEMGTPVYMSPEQIRTPHRVDHLSDVYSMGVVLYELLTRKVPFERDADFDTKEAVVKQSPAPPRRLNRNISVRLQRIVLKAMQKRPEDRFGGCAEFALEIDRCSRDTHHVRNPFEALLGRLATLARSIKHPRIAAALFLLLFVLILTAAIAAFFRAPTIALVAKPVMIRPGEAVLLEWNTQRAQRVRIEPEIGEVPVRGSRTVTPTQPVTYVATATGPGGTVSRTISITVEPAPPVVPSPTIVFEAKPPRVKPGQATQLEWETQNANTVRIEPEIGEVAATGSRTVTPAQSVTYVARATGPGGTVSGTVAITVESAAPVVLPPTIALVAKPAKIKPGQASQLEWSVQNAQRVRIEPGIGQVPAIGSRTVAPTASVTYVATATGPGGTVSKNVDITVEVLNPTITLVAQPERIRPGEAVLLEWNAQNANKVRIDPDLGEVPATGSQTVTPAQSVTYVATATGPGGSFEKRVDITVERPVQVPPTIALAAEPAMIKLGEPTLLRWRAQNANGVRIEPGLGEVAATGSQVVTPTSSGSMTYVATATGPGGSVSHNIRILVADGNGVKVKKLECKSRNRQPQLCDIGRAVPQNSRILGVVFSRQDSASPCVEGVTYRINLQAGTVWVDQGCDADFRIFFSRP